MQSADELLVNSNRAEKPIVHIERAFDPTLERNPNTDKWFDNFNVVVFKKWFQMYFWQEGESDGIVPKCIIATMVPKNGVGPIIKLFEDVYKINHSEEGDIDKMWKCSDGVYLCGSFSWNVYGKDVGSTRNSISSGVDLTYRRFFISFWQSKGGIKQGDGNTFLAEKQDIRLILEALEQANKVYEEMKK